jgi:hypothetical protein
LFSNHHLHFFPQVGLHIDNKRQLFLVLLATATPCIPFLDYRLTPGALNITLEREGSAQETHWGLSRVRGGRLQPTHHNQPDPWVAEMGEQRFKLE